MDLVEEYCPLPMTSANPLLTWPIFGAVSLAAIFLSALVFKWWTGQRVTFALRSFAEQTMVPCLLDSNKWMKVPYFGRKITHCLYARIQGFAPIPPQHLMSSAPSNSPGILTVLKHKSPLNSQTQDTTLNRMTSGILTSNDFPVLPAQPRIFRTVDGFGNCPYSPHIGQAAQPYSYVMTSKKPVLDAGGNVVEPNQPKVDTIFNKLLLRKKFEPNEAGLNCLILDFATLLTHDLFNSKNGYNANSSYADLSPLYGNDADSARRVRTFKRGLLDLKKVPYSRSATNTEKVQELLLKAKQRAVEGAMGCGTADDVTAEDDVDKMKLLEDEYMSEGMKAADENNWDWGFVGWRALVELFGKEHNYVAQHLLKWYPDRFSHKFTDGRPVKSLQHMCDYYDTDGLERLNAAGDKEGVHAHGELRGKWINDEALYQTARYITTRVYANIILSDYASNFLGLDQLNDFFDGREKKLGNSCSYEFGLLYHWHCLLPDCEESAPETRGVPCPRAKLSDKRGPLDGDYYDQFDELGSDENGNDKVPAKDRTFLNLLGLKKRLLEKEAVAKKAELDAKNRATSRPAVNDAAAPAEEPAETLADFIDHLPDTSLKLERLLLSRYRTRIGRFGAFHTPEYMRAAETKTMEKARAQGIGSYNDFREHMGEWRCTTYEEINPDPEVAKVLRELYEPDGKGNDHVDDVELYPGVFADRAGRKGIKFGQILSMGLLEDALNLIRNDRLVVDFDANTATAKGYQHGVSSHFADVIERNTGLRLVKQNDQKQLVDYKSSYPCSDYRSWRLASCSLLTVPEEKGTTEGGFWTWLQDGFTAVVDYVLFKPRVGRNSIFCKTTCQPGVLAQYYDPVAYNRGLEAGKREAVQSARAEHKKPRAKAENAHAEPKKTPAVPEKTRTVPENANVEPKKTSAEPAKTRAGPENELPTQKGRPTVDVPAHVSKSGGNKGFADTPKGVIEHAGSKTPVSQANGLSPGQSPAAKAKDPGEGSGGRKEG